MSSQTAGLRTQELRDARDGKQPTPTTDIEAARRDLDRFGFCLVEGLLTDDQVMELQARLTRLAADEEARGLHDQAQGAASSQYVYMLINKGRIFVDLVQNPVVLKLIDHLLGPDCLLSATDGILCKPGGNFMPLHTDQWWMPEPTPRNRDYTRVGSLRRFTHRPDVGDAVKPISPPAVGNVMWMVTDFTPENGATRVVPGSHLAGEQPDPTVPYTVATVPGCGKAGTALVFDGRLWHATGANRTDRARIGIVTAYCGPQFRPMENYVVGARDEIVRLASPALLSLLGFRQWDGYGKLDDPGEEYISRDRQLAGEP